MFIDKDIQESKHCISPQKYLPNTRQEQITRFTNISFGFGPRSSSEIRGKLININLIVANLYNPGPGAYNLPSVFDKSRKIRVPLN